jgi:hypothetical protein
MKLRSPRRAVVVWSRSAGSSAGHKSARFARPGRARRLRRCIQIGGLLAVIGLVRLARAARPRWRLLLAGTVLTVVGVILRSGPGSVVFLPGILILLYAPLIEARPGADRKRRSELWRDLAGYATPAQRRDLEATFDRYPDAVTCELRDMLARQAPPPRNTTIPGVQGS